MLTVSVIIHIQLESILDISGAESIGMSRAERRGQRTAYLAWPLLH
jgi:hypothetical protein